MSGGHQDRALVSRAREGDRTAFALVVERHYPMLLGTCRRALHDAELARDAAQQAVLTAMLGLGRLRDDDRFGAWLIGIGLNVCRSLMGPRRRSVASLDGLSDRRERSALAASDPDLQEQLESAEVASRVRAAVAELPKGQRDAVSLYYLAGLTHGEIAEELGTQPGAVKTRLHKARRSLHSPLEPVWKEYFAMPTPTPDLIPVRIADLRRTTAGEPSTQRHVVFLEEIDAGRRMPIWIGPTEATGLAVILENVEVPRPGVHHFAAALLSATGSELREARIVKLTDTVFFAQVVLTDGSTVDARPSDALTLAALKDCPIYVASDVLDRAEERQPELSDLVAEALKAQDDATTLADEARARIQATTSPARRQR
jgi:RNA polymerase sigma-70 factor (ECF subfamily)